MRSVNCTPVTCPKLPPTHNHPLWQAWDLAVDMCVSQLPNLIANPQAEYKVIICITFLTQSTVQLIFLVTFDRF